MPDSENSAQETDALTIVAKKLGMSKEGLNETLDALDHASPALGGSLKSLFGGPVGIAAKGAEIIYDHNKQQLEEKNNLMDKQAELLARPLGGGADEYSKHIQDAKQAVADLKSALAHAGADTDPIGTQFKLIKTFADVFFEGAKREVEAQGKLEEAFLQTHNAPRQQIIEAQQRTRAKIALLAKQKSFFDGSGLLKLEQTARKNGTEGIAADASAAVVAKNQAIDKNDILQKNIRELTSETGNGEAAHNDPVYIFDHNRIAETRENLSEAEALLRSLIENDRKEGYSPEALQKHIKPYVQDVFSAEQDFQAAKKTVENKLTLLSRLKDKQDAYNHQQAEATATAADKAQTATINRGRLTRLTSDIAFAQFLEQMQQSFDTQVETINDATDALNIAPLSAKTDQGGQGIFQGSGSLIHGIDLNPIAGTQDIPGDGPVVQKFNILFSTLKANQETMLELLKKYGLDQGVLSDEMRALQTGNSVLQQQIYELQSAGHK